MPESRRDSDPDESALRAYVEGNVIHLDGELDVATVPEFVACAERVPLSSVLVDVTALRFIDCRGLAAVVRASERSREAGYNLTLRGATGIVKRVIVLAGFEGLLSGS